MMQARFSGCVVWKRRSIVCDRMAVWCVMCVCNMERRTHHSFRVCARQCKAVLVRAHHAEVGRGKRIRRTLALHLLAITVRFWESIHLFTHLATAVHSLLLLISTLQVSDAVSGCRGTHFTIHSLVLTIGRVHVDIHAPEVEGDVPQRVSPVHQ